MQTFYIYILSIFLLLGCNKNKKIQSSTDLEKYISGLKKIEVLKNNVDIDRNEVNSILSNIENSIPEKLIFVDHSNWSIFLAKKDGFLLDQKDGFLLDQKGGSGRGPGEFLGINDMYVYVDQKVLQVFDKRLKRLSYFNIANDSLHFSHIRQLPNYGQHYLQSIFRSNGIIIGIFRVLRQDENREIENKLYVHYLDEEFKKKEKILEIEGTELIETTGFNGDKRFRENLFGNETVWSFNNDKLYYSNAKNLDFKVFDFDNKNITEYKISDIPENINTSRAIDLMLDRYSRIFSINPEYEAYFKQREKLPYFSSIHAMNKFLYIPLFNYGYEKGYILRFNIETSEMERIETPANFFMKGVNKTGIYGTIAENDYNGRTTISILEFE